jgi:hypothetical protein
MKDVFLSQICSNREHMSRQLHVQVGVHSYAWMPGANITEVISCKDSMLLPASAACNMSCLEDTVCAKL